MIVDITLEHANDICGIYNYYVKNTIVTFEEDEVSLAEMQQRITSISKKFPWIVFLENKKVLGYAYASEWKSRCAYKNSVETTVYLNSSAKGRGIGSNLYNELLKKLRKMGFHAIIGGIALPNESSIALHEKFGFEKAAHFKEVGRKFDKWIDVGYWELILE